MVRNRYILETIWEDFFSIYGILGELLKALGICGYPRSGNMDMDRI